MRDSKLVVVAKILLMGVLAGTFAFVVLDTAETPLVERWYNLSACIGVASMSVGVVYSFSLWLRGRSRIDKRQPMLLGREQASSPQVRAE